MEGVTNNGGLVVGKFACLLESEIPSGNEMMGRMQSRDLILASETFSQNDQAIRCFASTMKGPVEHE